MVIKMNVPKLRFNDFNDDYQNITIGDVLKIKSGRDQKQVENKNGIYPILGTSGQIGRTNSFLYDKPSVLIGRKGTINKPQYMDTPFWTVDTLFYSDIFKPNVPKYIYYLFQNINWNKYDESTGVPSLNCKTIESIKTSIPSVNEQNKIAKFLSLLDKKIELQSQKIEALKLYKICIKNIIFNDEKYTETKLKYILKKWTEKNKNNEYDYVESVSNKHGFISQNEQFEDRNVASKDKSNYYVIRKNVFAYNPSRLDVGSLALKDNDLVSLVSPLYECFTTNQNVYFMLEWFDSKEFKKGTFSKFEGGVRNTLSFTNLCEINISLPSITEQDKIANILMSFNNKLIYENEKLKQLKNLKKGLIQNMFV